MHYSKSIAYTSTLTYASTKACPWLVSLSKTKTCQFSSVTSLCRPYALHTPFTRSSKHRANVEQMYSKYTC